MVEAHRALDDREKRTQGLTLTALLLSWLYCALGLLCLEYYTPTMELWNASAGRPTGTAKRHKKLLLLGQEPRRLKEAKL